MKNFEDRTMTATTTDDPTTRSRQESGRSPLRVMVVDDHAAVRLGVLRLLDDQPEIEAIAVATGAEALEAATESQIDVAVVDYQLAHGEDGLSVTCDLRSQLVAPPRILIYSAYADTLMAARAVIAGAHGILNKGGLGSELCDAIRAIQRGRSLWPVLPKSTVFTIGIRLPWEDRPLFRMWLAGASDEEIAATHGLSADALDHRRRSLLDRLGRVPGQGRFASDDGDWPLSFARARRMRGR
jgi:DNA-binding NarL/FixJ family response regulator